MRETFDIKKFNTIEDEENYYFFRALEPGDIEDLEKNLIKEGDKYIRLRTDRERWEETHQEEPRWNSESTVTLEEMYNHIKMHYSLQTNCISLSSNANVVRTYGDTFSDKYVMIKVPKKEMGEKVFTAGQYMLEEIEKHIEKAISERKLTKKVEEDLRKIDSAKSSNEIKEIIKKRYKSKEKINKSKSAIKKGIKYKAPTTRVSSYQALDEEQTLEKNKIIAKLTILENKKIIEPLISNTANNNSLIQTVGSAFSSSEEIYYGDIEGERITDVSKEIIDMFGLLQQAENQDKEAIDELKNILVEYVNNENRLDISDESVLRRDDKLKDDITIDEMYELTNGKVEFGKASSIVKNMFYLAKGQAEARELADKLRIISENNSKYEDIIKYIESNGFEIEPRIVTRQSSKGYRLSESVNLDLKPDEIELIEKIKELSNEEQEEIIQNGGLSNVKNIMNETFAKSMHEEQISRDEYYAEALFSLYNWSKIGVADFTIEEKNKLIKKIQESNVIEVYKNLEQQGIDKKILPTVVLNTIMGKQSDLNEDLSIERIERFLGYYDVENTGIQLRPYQQRSVEKTDEIFEDNRFASVILPTGGGKSFVAMTELMKHQNEDILYLAPQNEIIEQMKDNIIKYIHGPINTVGRSKDEIIADVFPNIKFSTYPHLLAEEGKEIVEKQYGFMVLDELHRTGADKWGEKLDTLLENQTEDAKVLGITATPRRDSDGINMANEIAQKLGYTNKEAVAGKHVAVNMSLVNAIRMGLVVNPKLVSCAYNLIEDGTLDDLRDKIEQIQDIEEKNEKLEHFESLRRNIENADGISKILQDNVKQGGKYIVFLPMVNQLEDEDGNVIGRKTGTDKIADYEKQIMEYFKDSDIKPNFHSMLGEYGDKENEKRLEEFQNDNSDSTDFMLVINKANEGLHLDKLDGIIWLRPLDENSRILYLQQLGRVIYSENPDSPTKDEDRPVVIDLVNNTLKVNWDNEITEQDDIEMLNLIIDWSENHDGILPNINSSDKEEIGYASVLKEIQNTYKEYLQGDFEDLNDKQIDEVKEIIELGNRINLWQMELPEKIIKDGGNKEGISKKKELGPFEVSGLLSDFVDLKEEVKEKTDLTPFEEVLKFCEENGRVPKGTNKGEGGLYQKWYKTKEKKIVDGYAGKNLEEIPEVHRAIVKQMREFGYKGRLKSEITPFEEVLQFCEENGRVPKNANKGECGLYQKWLKTKEKKIVDGYAGKNLEEIPEEHRALVEQMRKFGYGLTPFEEVLQFCEENGRVPSQHNKGEGTLYNKWLNTKEKKIVDGYDGKNLEEIPEEHRALVEQMRKFGYGLTPFEEVLQFCEENGRVPSQHNKGENGLYQKWKDTNEKKIVDGYKGKDLEEIPEEHRTLVKQMREFGYKGKKKRTSKDIAHASISSIEDIEMSDIEDQALKALVEKENQKGGIHIDEQ